jgi:CubicO group peptidase (beta-lactamase class C family)
LETASLLGRVKPEEVGIASKAIEQFIGLIRERQVALHSFMLLRHGKVAAEGFCAPFDKDRLHPIFSISKSVTSAAVGIAIGEGRFNLQDKAVELLAHHITGEVHPYTAKLTVEHLLKMTTVYHKAPSSETPNWVRTYLTSRPERPPGFLFAYDTSGTNLLCAILQETTGMTVHEYLQPRMFDAIGMGPLDWVSCPMGINRGGSGIRCTTEGLAHFGQLYLQDGIWNDRRVLPEGWVARSTARQVDNSGHKGMLDGKPGYGYQFWRLRNGACGAFGLGGQFVVVMPDKDAVFISTANTQFVKDGHQAILDCMWEALYPAMDGEGKAEAQSSLPAETASSILPVSGTAAEPAAFVVGSAGRGLAEQLASLQLSLPPGQPDCAMAAAVNGRFYRLEANRHGFTGCRFEFAGEASTLRLTRGKAAGGEAAELPFGLHHWVSATDSLFSGTEACCTSGTWVDGHTLLIHMHLLDRLQMVMFICHFEEDTMAIQLVMPGVHFKDELECDLIGTLADEGR